MGLYNIELGFWDGLLVTVAALLILYGIIVASSLAIGGAWALLVIIATLLVFVVGRRFVRRLIRGGGRR